GDAVRTTINKNGRQIVVATGVANTTVVYAGGDQTVHGYALDTCAVKMLIVLKSPCIHPC
nr:hypothetical protein [Escherichia coli]